MSSEPTETVALLMDAGREIDSLRRELVIAQAKVWGVEVMAKALEARVERGGGAVTEDISWAIHRHVSRLREEEEFRRNNTADRGEPVKVTTHEMELLRRRAEQRGDRVSVHLVPLEEVTSKSRLPKDYTINTLEKGWHHVKGGGKPKKAPRRMAMRRTAKKKNKKG